MAFRIKVVLLLLPVTLCLIEWLVTNSVFPIFSGPLEYDVDPAYQYLFNSLFLLKGHVPLHIDHPGTPLQVLGAVLIFCTWVLLSVVGVVDQSLELSVTLMPEVYLRVISIGLILINSGAIYFLGCRVSQTTKSICIALLSQCVFMSSSVLLFRIGYPSPEAFIIALTTCLLAVLAPFIFVQANTDERANKKQTANAIMAGLLCGMGVATKLNFLPILGLLFFFSAKPFFIAALCSLLGFLIGVLPIISKLPAVLTWLISIATHSGVHASGDVGMFVFPNFEWHFTKIQEAFPLYFIALRLLLVCVALQVFYWFLNAGMRFCRFEQPGHWLTQLTPKSVFLRSKTPFILSLVCVAQTVFILKHPGLHYLVPALPIGFIGFVWLVYIVISNKWTKKYSNYLSLFAFVVVSFVCATVVRESLSIIEKGRDEQNEALQRVQAAIARFPNPIIVTAYRSTLPLHAKAAGLSAPWGPYLGTSLEPMFEQFYMWDGGYKQLIRYGSELLLPTVLNDYLKQGRTVLLSTPTLYADLSVFILEPVIDNSVQQLYKIISVKTR
jgi:hypothetical protein